MSSNGHAHAGAQPEVPETPEVSEEPTPTQVEFIAGLIADFWETLATRGIPAEDATRLTEKYIEVTIGNRGGN